MRENWNFYKKRLSYLMFIIALVLGVHGLYAYYNPIIEKPWQLISAMLYGTMKLFLFSPPIPAQADSTLSYQVAMWLAPILTSALVLTKITNTLLHFINKIRNRMSKKHIVIFEKSDEIDALIDNLNKGSDLFDISLILKDPLPQEWKEQYEKKKVAVYQFNIETGNKRDLKGIFKTLNLNKSKYILLGSSSDLENYSLFQKIIKEIKPENEINVYINCESNSIPDYLERLLHLEKTVEPTLELLEIIPYNKRELTMRKLLGELQDSEGFLKLNFKEMDKSIKNAKDLSVEKIDEALGNVHFLVLGANELTPSFLKIAANNATISLENKISITVIDSDAETLTSKFLSNNEEIIGAMDIDAFAIDLKSRNLSRKLYEMKKENPPTAIFLMMEDTTTNLEILSVVDRYFYNEPKALRNTSGIDLDSLLPSGHEELKIFGDINEIMNEKVLIRSQLDNRAKAFNNAYNTTTEKSGMGSGTSWAELSQTKKESSRLSADHALIKEAIIRGIYPEKSIKELREMLSEKYSQFNTIQEHYKDDPQRFKSEFNLFLKDNPILDFMSRLEHKRWNNSYYSMNFRYGKEKDEYRKTHPCLIDDWQNIIGESFYTCHPEYDLIATFALFQEE